MSGFLSFFNSKPTPDTTLDKYKQDLDEVAKSMSNLQLKFSVYARTARGMAEIHADIADTIRSFNGDSRPFHPSSTTFHALQVAFRDEVCKRWDGQFADDVMVMFEHWSRQANGQRAVIANYEIERTHCLVLKEQVRERVEARSKYTDRGKQPPEALEKEIAVAEQQFKQQSLKLDSMRTSIITNQNRLAGPERFGLFDQLFVSMIQMQLSFEEELHLISKKYPMMIKQIRSLQDQANHASITSSEGDGEVDDISVAFGGSSRPSSLTSPSSILTPGSSSPLTRSRGRPISTLTQSNLAGSPTGFSLEGVSQGASSLPIPDATAFSSFDVTSSEKSADDSSVLTVAFAQELAAFLEQSRFEADEESMTEKTLDAFGLSSPLAKKTQQARGSSDTLDANAILECFSGVIPIAVSPQAQTESEQQHMLDPLGVGKVTAVPFNTTTSSSPSIDKTSSMVTEDMSAPFTPTRLNTVSVMKTPPTVVTSPSLEASSPVLARQSPAFAPGSSTKRRTRLSFGMSTLLNNNLTLDVSGVPASGPASPRGIRMTAAGSAFSSPIGSPKAVSMTSYVATVKSTPESIEEEDHAKSAVSSAVAEEQYLMELLDDDVPSDPSIVQEEESTGLSLLSTFDAIAAGDEGELELESKNDGNTSYSIAESNPELESDEDFLRRTAKWLRTSVRGPLIDSAKESKALALRMKAKELAIWCKPSRDQPGNTAPIRQLLSTLQSVLWPKNGLRHFVLFLLKDVDGVMAYTKTAFAVLSAIAERAIDPNFTSSSEYEAGVFSQDDLVKALTAVTVLKALRQSVQQLLEENSSESSEQVQNARGRSSSTASYLPSLPTATTTEFEA